MRISRVYKCVSLALAAALTASPAVPLCALARYKLSITVLDCENDQPIENVQVAFFANGESSEVWRDDVESSPALTDEEGRLSKLYWFDTYSGRGIIYSDRCKGKIKSLDVVAIHSGYRIGHFKFTGKDLKRRHNGDTIEIVMEAVSLRRLDD